MVYYIIIHHLYLLSTIHIIYDVCIHVYDHFILPNYFHLIYFI